jgi:hypothetical protein
VSVLSEFTQTSAELLEDRVGTLSRHARDGARRLSIPSTSYMTHALRTSGVHRRSK